ncbi:hypothetical protein LZ30DRAFT_775890 [Colletotrichum cereale]|nr:hypothetical protein LZ30DRAFT_775890 [Colletotrichum cereale]
MARADTKLFIGGQAAAISKTVLEDEWWEASENFYGHPSTRGREPAPVSTPGFHDIEDNENERTLDVSIREVEHAARPEPVPKRGQKRKSTELSKADGLGSDSDEFPDIYKMLGTPAPSISRLANRTTILPLSTQRETMDGGVVEKRTITQTVIPTQRTSIMNDSPNGISTPRQISRAKGNQQALGRAPSNALQISTSTGPSRKARALGFQASTQPIWPCAIKDPDDCFHVCDYDEHLLATRSCPTGTLMPATATQLRPASIPLDNTESFDEVTTLNTPSGPRSTAFKAMDHHRPVATDAGNLPSSDPSDDRLPQQIAASQGQKSAILKFILSNPNAIKAKEKMIEEQREQNSKDYAKALLKGSKEDRARVKSAREPLLKQYAGLQRVMKLLESLAALEDEKETLATKIANAHDKGYDTEKDENRLDDLADQVKMLEQSIDRDLPTAGVQDEFFTEGCGRSKPIGIGSLTLRSGLLISRPVGCVATAKARTNYTA